MNSFSVGGVLGRSFSIWLQNLVPFTFLSLLFYLPLLVYTWVTFSATPSMSEIATWTLVVSLGGLLLEFVAAGAMTYGVFQQLRGQHAGLAKCVGVGLARLFPVLGVALLMLLAIALGLVALIVPGLIIMCMLYASVPAAIIERPGVFGALKRSAELTAGYRWSIFGIIFIFGVIDRLANKILEVAMVGDGFETFADARTYTIVLVVLASVLGSLQAVTSAVVYHDLRVAKEGVASEELAKVFD